jgi:hypothetical protein
MGYCRILRFNVGQDHGMWGYLLIPHNDEDSVSVEETDAKTFCLDSACQESATFTQKLAPCSCTARSSVSVYTYSLCLEKLPSH